MARQHPRRNAAHEQFVAELIQRNFTFTQPVPCAGPLDQVGAMKPACRSKDYELWRDRDLGLSRSARRRAAGDQAQLANVAFHNTRRWSAGMGWLTGRSRAPPRLSAPQRLAEAAWTNYARGKVGGTRPLSRIVLGAEARSPR